LRALIDLELARRDALTTRTEDSYTTYTDLLRRALTSANRNLSGFTRSYKDAVRPEHERTATLNGLISKNVTLKALEILAARFEQVESEARARKACIAGLLYECGTVQEQTATPPTKQSHRDEVNMRSILGIFDKARNPTNPQRTIVGLESSSCMRGLNGADYVEVRAVVDFPFTAYAYVGDILVRRFTGDAGPTLTWFAEQRMEYLPYNPLIFYTCPEAASDISRSKTLAAIASSLFPLRTPTIIYESDLVEELKRVVDAPNTTISQKEALNALFRQYIYETAGFEDVVYDVVHGLRSALSMHEGGVPVDLGESVLFATQSGYYGLFLAHNGTAGGKKLSPYAAGTSEHFWKNFFRYSENKGTVSDEVLIRDLAIFFSAHDN
jgi:hypothetical protein